MRDKLAAFGCGFSTRDNSADAGENLAELRIPRSDRRGWKEKGMQTARLMVNAFRK